MSEFHIECISLSKQYLSNQQKVTAVDNINMQIRQNEMVLIKGRSGAGKSTLLNLMCGLIKPTKGKVIIGEKSINDLSDKALSDLLHNRIGIIFQSFNLLPTYSVYENIEIALIHKRINKTLMKEDIMSSLDKFNLKDKALLMPSELSVGQQQKVAVIRTLIKEPSILFADEPTGSVDDETATEILENLITLKKEKQITIVLATHGNVLEKFADKIFVIENGRLTD